MFKIPITPPSAFQSFHPDPTVATQTVMQLRSYTKKFNSEPTLLSQVAQETDDVAKELFKSIPLRINLEFAQQSAKTIGFKRTEAPKRPREGDSFIKDAPSKSLKSIDKEDSTSVSQPCF